MAKFVGAPVLLVDAGGEPYQASATDRDSVVSTFTVVNAFTGASIGDVVQHVRVVDLNDGGSTLAQFWTNLTTGLDLVGSPNYADLALEGTRGAVGLLQDGTPVNGANPLEAYDAVANAILAAIDEKLASGTNIPAEDAVGLNVRATPNHVHKVGFTKAVTNGVDPDVLVEKCVGAGMTRNQTNGTLVQASGTGVNQEFLAHSLFTVKGAFSLLFGETQSARVANHQAGIWVADKIGEGLSFTALSASSMRVDGVLGDWDTGNIGQSMNVSCMSLAGCIPGRYAITGVTNIVPGVSASLTFNVVSGWPTSGSGTLMLWAWNGFKLVASNTTTTNMGYSAFRRGYGLADTQMTISTITSGHLAMIFSDGLFASASDSAMGSQTGAASARGSRSQGVPDTDVELYVWLQQLNGTVAPVNTTWTVDIFVVEDIPANKVMIGASSRHAFNYVTHSGTMTVAGANAHDSSTLMNPILAAGRGSNALTTAVAHNDTTTMILDLRGRQIVYGAAPREISDPQYTEIISSVAETTICTAIASTFNDVFTIILSNKSATACPVLIKDGTGGTSRARPVVPANSTVVLTFAGQPHKQSGSNANWTATCLVSVDSIAITVVPVRS